MDDDAVVTALGARFDADEERLRGVALRVLGAGAEREAEAVLRRVRAGLGADPAAVVRLWLTALVARACLAGDGDGDSGGRGHARVAAVSAPVPVPVPVAEGLEEAVLVGFLAVLDRLGARERLAYLLHDVFGLPPGETARVMGGSAAEAARGARRARTRLRGESGEEAGRRALVEGFLAAVRARDAAALAGLLAPEAVAYTERGPVHGAAAVAVAATATAWPEALVRPALVEGSVGVVAFLGGKAVSAVAFGFRRDRILSLDITTGEEHVRALDLAFPEE
ncbi:sigma factor-like helix-turn-helix DNA-binding protein [Streptomyces sp. CC208A]|uniref:sigma factor-like helix-turn-helix DNA-binding protein n=1 Tax=Streptomyces sp. CC208A TaxID=3044573 RepID=UPI0024A90114|nr:sigma factor-like helix-turn-helix DNA-binding protein [Streptomyces sp. CC208A]